MKSLQKLKTAAVAGLSVFALVALSAVVEVVGHERVGYRHTVEALEDDAGRADRGRTGR